MFTCVYVCVFYTLSRRRVALYLSLFVCNHTRIQRRVLQNNIIRVHGVMEIIQVLLVKIEVVHAMMMMDGRIGKLQLLL